MVERVPKYLLDANLSPKIGRYLTARFDLDIVSLLTLGLGEISDQRDHTFVVLSEDRIEIHRS